jgi:hypothetical protein
MKAKCLHVLFFVVLGTFLLGAAPPNQGGYDPNVAVRFFGTWKWLENAGPKDQGAIPSYPYLVIEDHSTYSLVKWWAPNTTGTKLETHEGKAFTQGDKLVLYINGKPIDEYIILNNGHLLSTSIEFYSWPSTPHKLIFEYVRVSGPSGVPTNPPVPPVAPVAPVQPVKPVETPFFCDWPGVGFVACDLAEANPVQASTNLACSPQCVITARSKRPDLNEWASGIITSDNILAAAQSLTRDGKSFLYLGKQMQVRVRRSDESPQAEDLVIWPSGCQGVWSGGGHIGYNEANGSVSITDSNWDNKCGPRTKESITVDRSCVRFITAPFPVQTQQSTPTSPADKCSQYEGFRWLWCKLFGS